MENWERKSNDLVEGLHETGVGGTVPLVAELDLFNCIVLSPADVGRHCWLPCQQPLPRLLGTRTLTPKA